MNAACQICGSTHGDTHQRWCGAKARRESAEVFADVVAERMRQDAKWGEQNRPPLEWVSILPCRPGRSIR